MHQQPHIEKRTIDAQLVKELNKRTQNKADMLESAGKLVYVNDDYCEISRNYSSFYITNILYFFVFLPIVVSGFGVVLFFLYCVAFHFSEYVETFWSRKDDLMIILALHASIPIILVMTLVFAALVNYFFFTPQYYPIRFNRKTGKIYVYDYILYNIFHKQIYTFWIHHPFFKRTKPECKEFDWDHIQDVNIFARNKYSSNAAIHCLVYESSENINVIDSFALVSNDSATDALYMKNYKLWLWLNNYMNFKDDVLDMTANTDVGIYGRKVKWPDEINRKSVASSLDEYRKICSE